MSLVQKKVRLTPGQDAALRKLLAGRRKKGEESTMAALFRKALNHYLWTAFVAGELEEGDLP